MQENNPTPCEEQLTGEAQWQITGQGLQRAESSNMKATDRDRKRRLPSKSVVGPKRRDMPKGVFLHVVEEHSTSFTTCGTSAKKNGDRRSKNKIMWRWRSQV